MKLYGIKIKTKRLRRGWTQTILSKKARVGIVTVSRAESGVSISPTNAMRICNVLDMDLGEVMRPLESNGDAA